MLHAGKHKGYSCFLTPPPNLVHTTLPPPPPSAAFKWCSPPDTQVYAASLEESSEWPQPLESTFALNDVEVAAAGQDVFDGVVGIKSKLGHAPCCLPPTCQLKHRLHQSQQRATLCSQAAAEAEESRAEAERSRALADARAGGWQRDGEAAEAERRRLSEELQQLKTEVPRQRARTRLHFM